MARRAKETAKPKREKSDLSQFERFVQTARAVEADETGDTFEKAFEKLVPAKQRPRSQRGRPPATKKK
jgi:hypothetical protein